MGFGDNTRPKDNANGSTDNQGKSESAYFKLVGEQVIRILDETEDVFAYWRYYMPVNVNGTQQDRSITVGRNGPIAQFMKEIGDQDRRFRKPSKRILSNILDRATSTVKVLDYGPDMLNKFTALHRRVRRPGSMEPMNIWDIDLNVISTPGKEPKDVTRMVYPSDDMSPLAADLKALPKYDLTEFARPMPEDMQVRILAGEDLFEILKELNWTRPVPSVVQ
jgi:hypothetical protein